MKTYRELIASGTKEEWLEFIDFLLDGARTVNAQRHIERFEHIRSIENLEEMKTELMKFVKLPPTIQCAQCGSNIVMRPPCQDQAKFGVKGVFECTNCGYKTVKV